MTAYVELVGLYSFLVSYLLLIGTNRLCGYPPGWGRSAAAASAGAVYATLCMVEGMEFLGDFLWRMASLGIISSIAFGISKTAVRRTVLFIVLNMALGGISLDMESPGMVSVVIAAVILCILCWIGFPDRLGSTKYIPVELLYNDRHVRLIALQDTGNTLRDPVSGAPVLIVDADIAMALMGLSRNQLQNPISTMKQATISGLRLIPYRTVGQPTGILLAIRLRNVHIGKWKGSSIVAFAPDILDQEGGYQALTGGTI